MRASVVAVIAAASLSTVAFADITYISQSRTVNALSVVPASGMQGGLSSQSSSATGAFSDSASSASVYADGVGQSSASATQTSTLLPGAMTLVGRGEGSFTLGGGSMGGYSASSGNQMEVTFQLAEASSFTLDLEYTVGGDNGPVPSLPRFSLSGPGGFTPFLLDTRSGSLHTSGAMPAGEYQLTIDVQRTISFNVPFVSSYNNSVDFSLVVVPAPASAMLLLTGGAVLGRRRR